MIDSSPSNPWLRAVHETTLLAHAYEAMPVPDDGADWGHFVDADNQVSPFKASRALRAHAVASSSGMRRTQSVASSLGERSSPASVMELASGEPDGPPPPLPLPRRPISRS